MDKSRPMFQVRPQTLGERLTWRYPGRQPAIRRALIEATGLAEIPQSITLGYYRRLDQPAGAWCFMPRTDPLVCAALEIDMVRARICEDLAIRISEELAR